MAVQVHVEGQIAYGRLPDFAEAVRAYTAYARANGYVSPQVLQGISGPMNTIRLVYRYEALEEYERHEARTASDREYGRLASMMPFIEGSILYQIYLEMNEETGKGGEQ
jgi:hypothetical protein